MKTMTRRILTAAVLAGTGLAFAEPAPNYWCTWGIQGSTAKEHVRRGKILFDGDQGGTVPQRNNLNERVLFDADGWANTMWPRIRSELYLLLDDGWDVPYGSNNDRTGISVFGACCPDETRFASFKGTPGERLRQIDEKAKACGWRGVALWVAAQTPGERGWDPALKRQSFLSDAESRAAWAERMRWSKEAGVTYWKVDWGLHAGSADYRALMSEVRDRVYPELRLEHCWSMKPFNGLEADRTTGELVGTGRWFGDPAFAARRPQVEKILRVSDVFRTYDVMGAFADVTTIERCAWLSELAETFDGKVLLNVEGAHLVGIALGHTGGFMGRNESTAQVRNEDVMLAWQKIAPPFGHDRGIVSRHSEESLTDEWHFAPGSTWYTPAENRTVRQSAPAVVSRGLPLPEVRAEGPKPFVCCGRYPNGAMAVSFLPRTLNGRRRVECPADVTLDARLELGKPLGLFGRFKSVTLAGGAPKGARLYARQLPSGKPRDVTALCTVRSDGALVIPPSVMDRAEGFQCHAVIEAVAAWRPAQRWMGVNLPYCLYHKEVRKDATYNEEDFRFVRELGLNFIRLPLDYRLWIADGDWNRIDDRALAPLDQALEWGEKYGLHLQFCFHRAPGFSVNRWPAETRNLFREKEVQAVCRRHWAHFARRYRHVPNERLSFNLFNESPAATNLAEVELMLVKAIHEEDPKRFVVADGAGCCQSPVAALEAEKGLVGQAARGYSPMAISHCGVKWMGDMAKNFAPRWPTYGFASPLYGSGKAEWRTPLRIADAPAGTWTVSFGTVSSDNRMVVTADGRTLADWRLSPQTNSAEWVDAKYVARWRLTTGSPAKPFVFRLEAPAKELKLEIPTGDWVEVKSLVVTAGEKTATLPSDYVWGRKENVAPFVFRGWDEEIPFLAEGCPLTGAGWLEQKSLAEWIACAKRGNFVMIGECGASGGAPYDLYLRWMGDQLKVWQKHGFGFAMWTLRGAYGLIDTRRKGAVEVDFHGHRLDKGLMDLINRYR